jgi:hypothetical protein
MMIGQVASFRVDDRVFCEVFNHVMDTTGSNRTELLKRATKAGLLSAAKELMVDKAELQQRITDQIREAANAMAGVSPSRGTAGKAPSAAGIVDSVVPSVVASARKPRKP